MSSVDSQVVDGVWGTPIPDSGTGPAPEYNPSAVESEPTHDLPIGQEVARRSAWDVPPSPDEDVQVAPPASASTPTEPFTPSTEPTPQQAAAPDPSDSLRQQVEQLQRDLAARQQREDEGRRQWEQQVAAARQQQVFDQRQKAINDAIEQASYLDTDGAKNYLRTQYGQIEQQYQNDINQIRAESEQRLRDAIRQATAPQWGDHLLETNGLPREFASHLKGLAPEQMEYVVPTLKALYETQTKLDAQMKQATASNFNEFQRQHGVNRIANANGAPAGAATVKSGSIEHLAALMADMG